MEPQCKFYLRCRGKAMELEHLAEKLSAHENASEKRYENLKTCIEETAMSQMPEVRNIFEGGGMGGAGAGLGAGLGGGLLGGILGGALLGGRGLGGLGGVGGGVVEQCATVNQLQTATGSIIDAGQNNQIMGMLQGIATSVPVAEGQVQLALAQATGQLSNQINTNLVSGTQGFANTNAAIATATAGIIAVGESVKDTVNMTSAATQLAIANSVAQGLQNTNFIVTQVRDDGDKTRALITAQNEAGLRNEITALQIRLQEQRSDALARGTEVNVTQTVNQNQAQLQVQAQQQQQFQVLAQLAAGIHNLAGDIQAVRQTQSNINFGVQAGTSQSNAATNNKVS